MDSKHSQSMEAETKMLGRTVSSTLIEHGNVQYFIEELGHVVLRAERGSNPEIVAGKRGVAGLVDGGPSKSRLNAPSSVTLSDDQKSLIIVDHGNSAVRGLDLQTLLLTTLVGTPSEENTVETWLYSCDHLLSPSGSISIVKTEANGEWSTAFGAPVAVRAEAGSEDVYWTVRVQKCGKYGIRIGLAWVGTSCDDVRRSLGGFSMDWWTQGSPSWESYLRFFYYSGGDGTLREGGDTVHGPSAEASGEAYARNWACLTGDTILMHLTRQQPEDQETQQLGFGVLTFFLNGKQVPGSLRDLPMDARGCQGLTPVVSLASVSDAVRLYWGERGSPGGSPTASPDRRAGSVNTGLCIPSPWMAWADSVQIKGKVVTCTTDGPSAALFGAGMRWGRHEAKFQVKQDVGGLFIGVCDSDLPLYKTWSNINFRKRVWFLSYYGAMRAGDLMVQKQPIEFGKGDVVTVEFDRDMGEVSFKIDGKPVGRMSGLPNAASNVTMHMAVCMFKAGDCVEVGGDHLDVMIPSRSRAHRSLKDVSVHGPAWDIETRKFQLDWQNFRLRERMRTGLSHMITEALQVVLDEVEKGTRVRGEKEPCDEVLTVITYEETNVRTIACRILGKLALTEMDGVEEALMSRMSREEEDAAGVRQAAKDALTQIRAAQASQHH